MRWILFELFILYFIINMNFIDPSHKKNCAIVSQKIYSRFYWYNSMIYSIILKNQFN